jgi:hypothetical protein
LVVRKLDEHRTPGRPFPFQDPRVVFHCNNLARIAFKDPVKAGKIILVPRFIVDVDQRNEVATQILISLSCAQKKRI